MSYLRMDKSARDPLLAASSGRPLYAVLDTNVHLEFLDFTQVDWPSVLTGDPVYLVVPHVVLRELDDHKYDRRSKRRQQRARMIVARLLRDNVVIVSDDAGMLLKARGHGINAHQMDDKFRLKDEPTEEEVKLRDLQAQIEEMRSGRKSILRVAIALGSARSNEIVVEKPYRMRYAPGDEVRPSSVFEMHRQAIDPRKVAAAAEVLNWGIRVTPVVINVGPGSATNVVLVIVVPKPHVVKEGPPYVPSENRLFDFPVARPPTVFDPVTVDAVEEDSKTFKVRYRIKTLVHATEEELPEFFLLFPEAARLEKQECRLTYRVVSDQSEMTSGDLAVTLAWKSDRILDVSYDHLRRLVP